MQKRLVRIVSALVSLFVLALLLVQLETSEATRPFHTIAYTQASFTNSQDTVSRLVAKLNNGMRATGSTAYLTVPDQKDGVNSVRSYWLGSRPGHSLAGAAWGTLPLQWMKPGRRGTLEPLKYIGNRSPAGTYSFSSLDGCHHFTLLARDLGGQSVGCLITPFRGWALFPSGVIDGPTEILAFAALLLLGICLVWAYDGSLSRSQAIRLQAGTSLNSMCWQDASHLLSLQIVPISTVWVISCIYISVTRHQIHPVLLWTIASFLSLSLMSMFLGIVCALATLILHPRVVQLAYRRNNLLVLAGGTEVLAVLCLALSLVAASLGLGTAAISFRQRESALIWSRADTALKVQLRTTVGKPVPLPDYWPFIRRMLSTETTAYSSSVGDDFIDQSRVRPPVTDTHEVGGRLSLPGGYDDVVIVDKAYLRVLHIKVNELARIPSSGRQSAFLKGVADTEKDQFVRGFDVRSHLYRWTSSVSFPALGSQGGLNGSIVSSRKPLIILVDSTADLQVAEGLDMSLFNGNLIFTDRAVLAREVRASPRIRNNVISIDAVSDAAMEDAQQWGAIAFQALVGAALALAIVILTAIQAAVLWAQRNRTRIFIRHTAGQTYARISSVRMIVTAVLLLIGVAMTVSLSTSWETMQAGLLVGFSILAVYAICALTADLLACRAAFWHVVRREE